MGDLVATDDPPFLPDRAKPFVRAAFGAMAAAWPLDVDALARQSDPLTCDAALLPFLFFDRGGTLWSDAWPVAKQRQVVRDLFTYKRLEGTPAGVEAYLNLADAFIFREVLPPAQAFALPDTGLTHEQVQALMPQLRLYHRWPDRPRQHQAFAGRDKAGHTFAVRDVVGPRGRYPVLWDRGVETPLGVADAGLDGKTAVLFYEGSKGSGAFAGRSFAGASLFGRPSGGRTISFPLLDVTQTYQRDATPLQARVAAAGRGEARATFARNDVGGRSAYDLLTLDDPGRLPSVLGKARAAAFAGYTWIGLKPYHALITASVPGDPAGMPRRRLHSGQAFAMPNRGASLRFAMRAANAARRAGDRILVDLNPTAKGGRAARLPDLDPDLLPERNP